MRHLGKTKKKTVAVFAACLVLVFAVSIAVISLFTYNRIAGYAGFEFDTFTFREDEFVSQYFEFTNGKSYGKMAYRGESNPVSWSNVRGVKGDSKPNFLFVHDGDNAHHFVRKGVSIPTTGEISAVYCRGANHYQREHGVTRKDTDIAMFKKISALDGELVEFQTDNLAAARRQFYFAYNDCPVAAFSPGSIVYAEDQFFFVKTGDSAFSYHTEGNSMHGSGQGVIIQDSTLIEFIKKDIILILPASYPGA